MDTANLEVQLAAIRAPVFSFPWPEACAPNADIIEKRMIEWADRHGLLPNEAYRERVKRSRYARMAARCYPNAEQKLLQVIADLLVWYFLTDDLLVDRVETVTPTTLPCLTAMIDVLDLNCAGPQPVYGELALLDVSHRLRGLLSAEAFERFAQGMRLWATAAGLQILNHLRAESVDIPQYEAIRRYTGGVSPCLALSDAANGGSVDAEEFYRPDVQTLLRHANNIVTWSNDIHSLILEARQPGQFRNMVVIYASGGRTLQDAVECTAKRVYDEISQFIQLRDAIWPDASARLRGLLQGCQYWLRGYQDWVQKDTLRYAAAFAVADADDRGVLEARG